MGFILTDPEFYSPRSIGVENANDAGGVDGIDLEGPRLVTGSGLVYVTRKVLEQFLCPIDHDPTTGVSP